MDTKPLLTLAETSEFLNIRPGTQDARVSTIVALATASIERATGRYFTLQPFVEYLTTRDNQRTDYDFRGSSDYSAPSSDIGGMRTIIAPQSMPLLGVAVDTETVSAWYNPYARSSVDYVDGQRLTPGVDFQIDPEVDRLHLYVGTRFRLRALKVQYMAGYAPVTNDENEHEVTLSPSIPDWLRSAALIQSQFLNIKLRSDNIAMMSERTVSEKGKMAVSNFLAVSGVTPEIVPFIAHLKRAGVGRG